MEHICCQMHSSRSESDNNTGAVVMAATVFALLHPFYPFNKIIYDEEIILKLFCVSLWCFRLMGSSYEYEK